MKYTKIHNIAARKVRSKRRFYRHFAFYASAMFMMAAINIFTYNWHDGLWFIFPLVIWGSLIMLQYLLVFGFPISRALSEEWEVDQMKRELYKLDKSSMEQDEYQGLSMEERLELKELDRLKSKWESDQYV